MEEALKIWCGTGTETAGEGETQQMCREALEQISAVVPETITFLELVEHMRSYLTHEDGRVRGRANQLLVEVISASPPSQVNGQVASTFSSFFTNRLSDYPSAEASIRGMHMLINKYAEQLTADDVDKFVTTLFEEIHVPATEQRIRQQVFELLHLVFTTPSVSAFVERDPLTFAARFSDAMEAEKDPRCLVQCLTTLGMIVSCYGPKLESLADQLFDVTACYFPITFNPPPNNPYGITKQALVTTLHDCLLAHEIFIPHLMPLLVEKVRSTLPIAKRDSFSVLAGAVERFGVGAVCKEGAELADLIREEVIHGDNDDCIHAALSAATTITREAFVEAAKRGRRREGEMGAEGVGSSDTRGLELFVFPWVQKCGYEISRSAESMVGRASGKLLAAICAAGGSALKLVLKETVPVLCRGIKSSQRGSGDGPGGINRDSVGTVCSSLRILGAILTCVDPAVNYSLGEHPVNEYAEVLLTTLLLVLHHPPKSTTEMEEGLGAGLGGDPLPLASGSLPSGLNLDEESGVRVEAMGLGIKALEALLSRPSSLSLKEGQVWRK